jgi:outer membrane biosynthesis protein TonB
MGAGVFDHFQFQTNTVSLRVWLGARIAALLVGVVVMWALWRLEPYDIPTENPVIEAIAPARLEAAIPKPAIETRQPDPLPEQVQSPIQQAAPTPTTNQAVRASQPPTQITDRPTPQVSPNRIQGAPPAATSPPTRPAPPTNAPAAPAPGPTPRLATAPSGSPTGQSGPSAGADNRRLGGNSLAIIKARECARLDTRDRPADCPPNEELARLLAQERGPQYRPENAEGFSRNELAWRGIPPPCLDDGENSAIKGTTLCVRFGNIPSRVRSPREICEARGLGGCEDTPAQTAVNAAVEQVRRQQSVKQANR